MSHVTCSFTVYECTKMQLQTVLCSSCTDDMVL